MFYKEKLEQLLNKPMTRQEFLRNVGLMLLGFIGLGSALNTLAHGHSHPESHNQLGVHHGFGGGKFGV